MRELVVTMDRLAQNIADGRSGLYADDYAAFWHDLSRAGELVWGNDHNQAARELDYLRLRIPEARKTYTQAKRTEARAVRTVQEYERQLALHGNDEAAVVATAAALGVSPATVYRARKQVGTQTVVGLGTTKAQGPD